MLIYEKEETIPMIYDIINYKQTSNGYAIEKEDPIIHSRYKSQLASSPRTIQSNMEFHCRAPTTDRLTG